MLQKTPVKDGKKNRYVYNQLREEKKRIPKGNISFITFTYNEIPCYTIYIFVTGGTYGKKNKHYYSLL